MRMYILTNYKNVVVYRLGEHPTNAKSTQDLSAARLATEAPKHQRKFQMQCHQHVQRCHG